MPLYTFPNGAQGLIDFYYEYESTKPTIAILPPAMGYSAIYRDYIHDPELYERYNIIGLEPSVSLGPTQSVVDPRYDQFVAATELAIMLDAFSIPPVHIFAPETHSPHIAFSLVAAHPERVASLTLLGGASIKEASYQQFMETAPLHLNPWHPEGFMEVMSVLASLYYGPDHETIPPDTLDALVDADARICINRPETLYMFWRGFLERDWAADRLLPQISCEVLFFQHEVEEAVEGPNLASECVKIMPVQKAQVCNLKNARPGLALARPQEVLPVFKDFLSRQKVELGFTKSDLSASLRHVQELFGSKGGDFVMREPNDPFSFSTLAPEVIAEIDQHLKQLTKEHAVRKDTPCPLPFGQGSVPWAHPADKLSARFSQRRGWDEEVKPTVTKIVVNCEEEEEEQESTEGANSTSA